MKGVKKMRKSRKLGLGAFEKGFYHWIKQYIHLTSRDKNLKKAGVAVKMNLKQQIGWVDREKNITPKMV